MKDKEKKLASVMLDLLSHILSNRSCNDFDFPESWSKSDILNFVKEYHEWNGDPEEFDEEYLHLPDFCVASLLSVKLNKLIKE